MSTPTVSVIIPAYNAAPWLKSAVDSIHAQSFQDWELIIVNDGSTDDTLQVAHDQKDHRVHVIDQRNAGVSAARNAGLTKALGNFIAFMDADDAMLPHNLESRLNYMNEHGAMWAYADVAHCDPQLMATGEIQRGVHSEDILRLLLASQPSVPLAGSNLMIRRTCVEEGVRFDEHLSTSADQDFSMQLASRYPGVHVPETLVLYRVLPGSMSKSVALYERDHLYLFRKAADLGYFKGDRKFQAKCMANVYWAIGGSWWLLARRPGKAIPFFIRAVFLSPGVIIRPIRSRVRAWLERTFWASGNSSHIA